MNLNKRKKFFLRFLKENNIYSLYFQNIRKENYFSFEEVKSIIESIDCSNAINRTLTWCNTIEGFDFWHKINEKFVKEYRENNSI